MLFIQYPPCTTCQKAKKWLDGKEISYTDRHIKEQNPTYEELKAWYERSGLLYKSLNLKDKLPTMTEEEQLQLLASDGMLVKRPLLVTETAVLVGFKEKEWEDKLP